MRDWAGPSEAWPGQEQVSAQAWNTLVEIAGRAITIPWGEVGRSYIAIGDPAAPGWQSPSQQYRYIDVVVCPPWNRCGQYLVFPQKRIYLPASCIVVDLPPTVVPLHECQSTGSDGSGGLGLDGPPPLP